MDCVCWALLLSGSSASALRLALVKIGNPFGDFLAHALECAAPLFINSSTRIAGAIIQAVCGVAIHGLLGRYTNALQLRNSIVFNSGPSKPPLRGLLEDAAKKEAALFQFRGRDLGSCLEDLPQHCDPLQVQLDGAAARLLPG